MSAKLFALFTFAEFVGVVIPSFNKSAKTYASAFVDAPFDAFATCCVAKYLPKSFLTSGSLPHADAVSATIPASPAEASYPALECDRCVDCLTLYFIV